MPIQIGGRWPGTFSPQLDDALQIAHRPRDSDAHRLLYNASARVLKPDPLGRPDVGHRPAGHVRAPLLRRTVALAGAGRWPDLTSSRGRQTFRLHRRRAVPAGTSVSIAEPNRRIVLPSTFWSVNPTCAAVSWCRRRRRPRRGGHRWRRVIPGPGSIDGHWPVYDLLCHRRGPQSRGHPPFLKPGGIAVNVVTDEATAYHGIGVAIVCRLGGRHNRPPNSVTHLIV